MSEYEWVDSGHGRQILIKKGESRPERRRSAPGAGWPLECVASGVHPNQAEELKSHLAERGVKVQVSRDGNPIYTSAAQRRKALRARGLHDRNSYT